MIEETFRLDVVARVERKTIYKALALIEMATRSEWMPVEDELPPWRSAGKAFGALLKLSGVESPEAAVELSAHMDRMQRRAVKESRNAS